MDSSASDKSKLTSSPMQDQNIPTAFKSESSLACQIEQIEGTLKSIYLAYLSTSLAFVSNSLRLKFNLSEVYPASTLPKNHRRSDVPQTRLETIYRTCTTGQWNTFRSLQDRSGLLNQEDQMSIRVLGIHIEFSKNFLSKPTVPIAQSA